MEIRFPSGRAKVIPDAGESPMRSGVSATPYVLLRPPHPCVHLLKPIHVKLGCSGASRASTWGCELHGQCAPLAIADIKLDGVTVCRLCPDHAPAPEPGWTKLGLNFASALARWVQAGRPAPTPQLVAERLKICTGCPFLANRGEPRQHCTKCGCFVNGRLDPTKNKLAMPTESCPLEKPLWKAVSG